MNCFISVARLHGKKETFDAQALPAKKHPFCDHAKEKYTFPPKRL